MVDKDFEKNMEEGKRKMENTFLQQTIIWRESAVFMQQLIEDYGMDDLLDDIDYPFEQTFDELVSEIISFHRRVKNEIERRKYHGQ